MDYTGEQQAFLNHPPSASARVLAGPGTGKSFTSVAYLEKAVAENPGLRVGYVTFTRAATAEFAQKLVDAEFEALGDRKPQTVHGYALGVLMRLRTERLPYPLRIPDRWEVKHLIWPDLVAVLRAQGYGQARANLIKKLEQELSAGFETLDRQRLPLAEEQPELVDAYRGAWRAHRSLYGYTLLSELPYQAGAVLEDMDGENLDLDLLIVDEYQDLNAADQRLLSQVAARGVAIIAIGDDDQSIYSWRNAAPVGIRNFLTTFGATNDYPLTISQRCGGAALEVASRLIEQDSGRQRKPRLSASERAQDTEFRYLRFPSNVAEARGVAHIIRERIDEGVDPTSIAVIVRSKAETWKKELTPHLVEQQIPVQDTTDFDELLSEVSIRQILSLAHLLADPLDSLAWRGLLEVTPRIGPTFVRAVETSTTRGTFAERLMAVASDDRVTVAGSTQARDLIARTRQWLEEHPLDAIEVDDDGWGKWFIANAGVTELPEGAVQLLMTVGETIGSQSLGRFLADFETTGRELAIAATGGIRVMTMSQSKGLTVNTAIVMGIDASNIPRLDCDIDEERRLLYVAFTRATDLTVASFASQRIGPTARLGNERVGRQREQCPFLTDLGLTPERI